MNRAALFSGLALLAAIWAGPLLDAWRGSFAAHMLAHMGVVAIAAPLLAIGLAGAASAMLCRLTDRAASRLPSLPVVASLVDLVVVWGWHAPALRALAVGSIAATAAEQLSFLAAGMLLWLTCLSGAGRDRGGSVAGGFALLLTSVHMTLLGALLALSPRPLYGLDDVTCFGTTLSAEQDQHIGGIVMLLVGGAVYLAGGLTLFARLLASDAASKVIR